MAQYIDYAKLKERISIGRVTMEMLQLSLEIKGEQLVGSCPICSSDLDSTAFKVTPSKAAWKCFGACKEGGNYIDLVAKTRKVNITQAARDIAEHFGVTDECLLERSPKRSSLKTDAAALTKGASIDDGGQQVDTKAAPLQITSASPEPVLRVELISFSEACRRIKYDGLDRLQLRVVDMSKLDSTDMPHPDFDLDEFIDDH